MGMNEPDLHNVKGAQPYTYYIYIRSVGKRNNAEASGCNLLARYGKTLPYIYQPLSSLYI